MKSKLESLNLSRRDWVRSALLMSVAPQAARAAQRPLLPTGVVLFQGDSITDAGRNRERPAPNDSSGMGRGYPLLIASHLLGSRAQDGLRVYNRGISGNKVPDLDARWQTDTLNRRPDLLSILVGVNDIWHKLGGRYNGTVESYEKGYAALLARTRKAMSYTRVVVCEPFVLRCGAVTDAWFPEFDLRRAAAKRVAQAAGADWVPFQSMFDEALKHAEPAFWAADGVHPTLAGHGLMAKTWLDVVKP